MAVAPGYLRQIGLPTTTGQRGLPSVQINDYIGQAVGKGSDVMTAIGGQMTQIQADSDVSQAKVNATLKLNKLEVEMSTMDGLPAVIDETFQTEQTKIFQEAGSHITDKRAQKIFSDNFEVLSAQSQLKIKSAGVKRKFAKAEGDLEFSLDMYSRSLAVFKPGTKPTKVDVDTAIKMGIADIENAVKNGVIAADKGAKRALKFVSHLADNAVVGWLNDPLAGTTRSKLIEMETGKFVDQDIQKYWELIGSDERKKAGLISSAITNISRSLTFKSRKEKNDIATAKTAAMKLQLEFYQLNTSQERKTTILSKLAKNPQTNPSAYNTMVQDLSGRTSRFDDTEAGNKLLIKIMRTPQLVTTTDIINSKLSNIDELLKLYETKSEGRTAKAKKIILAEPGFIATNRRDKRSDVLGVAQAEIWTTILAEQIEATDKGKSYDPVKRTQELILEFKKGAADNTIEERKEAIELLTMLGITKKEEVESVISVLIKDGYTTAEIQKIRNAARIAF